MEEPQRKQRDISFRRSKLVFLYDQSAMSSCCIKCWLEENEFVERVWDEIRRGVRINDEVLLSIIRPLYDEISSNRDLYSKYKVQTARRGMHQLERACAQHKIQ